MSNDSGFPIIATPLTSPPTRKLMGSLASIPQVYQPQTPGISEIQLQTQPWDEFAETLNFPSNLPFPFELADRLSPTDAANHFNLPRAAYDVGTIFEMANVYNNLNVDF
jgi:hypothetical protein